MRPCWTGVGKLQSEGHILPICSFNLACQRLVPKCPNQKPECACVWNVGGNQSAWGSKLLNVRVVNNTVLTYSQCKCKYCNAFFVYVSYVCIWYVCGP